MLHSKLIAVVFAVLALVVPQIASATAVSTSPQACRLTDGALNENSAASGFSDGKFWNNSGSYAWAMCPVSTLDGNYNFYIGTSSTTASCYLKTTGLWGGGTSLVFGTRYGNYVYFYSPLNAGSYNNVLLCYLPAGTSVYGMMNN